MVFLKRIIVICLALSLLLISSCTEQEESESKAIRIGYFPNITHAQALIGMDGIYEEALPGYELRWTRFNAGSSEIEALMAGEIDLGYIGPGPAINGYIKSNGGLKILAGASEAGAALVCRGDLDIKEIKDLAGHRIAIPQIGNTQHIVLEEMLAEKGMKSTSNGGGVEIIAVENPDTITLFDQKSLDAAFVPEPWASKLIEEGGARLVLEYNQTWRNGEYPVAVLIGRTEFIENNQDVIEEFLKTHHDITNKINSDKNDAIEGINRGLESALGKPLEKEVLDSSLSRMAFTTEINKQAIFDMKDIMYELDLIHDDTDIKQIFK